MAITAKVVDQLVTDSGTTVTVMELSPFTHLETTEATIKSGVACQPYGVVMAPADAVGGTEVTFSQEGAEDILIDLTTIKSTTKGNDLISSGDNIVLPVSDAEFWTPSGSSPGNLDDAQKIYINKSVFNMPEDPPHNVILLLYDGAVDDIASIELDFKDGTKWGFTDIHRGTLSFSSAEDARTHGASYYLANVQNDVKAIWASDLINYEDMLVINKADILLITISSVEAS